MKTENDILAEYVREKHPNIANSVEYTLYRAGIRIGEATTALCERYQSLLNTPEEDENHEL